MFVSFVDCGRMKDRDYDGHNRCECIYYVWDIITGRDTATDSVRSGHYVLAISLGLLLALEGGDGASGTAGIAGNCKTAMIVCIAPTSLHFDDPHNTHI